MSTEDVKAAEPVSSHPPSTIDPPAIPSPAPIPAASKPKALVAAAPSHIDAFLTRLQRCITTRAGADAILLFLTYATRFSADILDATSRAALRNSANKLVALAFQLPPATAVNLKAAAPVASPVISVALQLAARLKAASATLSEVRTFGRLWGLLGLYFAAKKLVLRATAKKADSEKEKIQSSDDVAEARFDMLVAGLQIFSLINFQAAENVAYLSARKILGFGPETQGKLARWSVRSWAIYIFMDLARLVIERQRRVAKAGGRLTAKDAAWSQRWKTEFSRTLAWAPITVHYSVGGEGILSDLGVSALAFWPGVSALREVWQANA